MGFIITLRTSANAREDGGLFRGGVMSLLYLGDKKRCSKCREYKAIGDFWRNEKYCYGACKKCVNKKARKYSSREDMFWKRLHARTQEVGNCLEWTGGYFKNSPGCHWKGRAGASVRRIIYKLAIGDLPDDMFVTTTCFNHRCVRQSHIVKVTKEELDVMRLNNLPCGDRHYTRVSPDKVSRGSSNGNSKLITSDVLLIRELHRTGFTAPEIVRRINENYCDSSKISKTQVRGIIRRETWKHVE